MQRIWRALRAQGKEIPNRADGATPLFVAAYNDNLDMVQRLVREGGATVNQATHNGHTALYAAVGGHLDIVQWLVLEGGGEQP